MKKILHTLSLSIASFFEDYLITALIITVCGAVIMFAGTLISAKIKGKSAKHAIKENSKAFCVSLIFLFYFSLILNVTVFMRLSMPEYDPFSKVFGGWVVEDMIYYYDFSSVLNILMFMPLCTILFIFIKEALRKNISFKALALTTSLTGFLTSCLIELLQIIFKAGTFQISDIVYNTLGSLLSIGIFILLKKIYNSDTFKKAEINIKSRLREHKKGRA